ncbi:hypothetical protein HPB50_010104 [Hyalomma asiaticum]|uniref:Uncharacterized protein n=1 Tax=Hyalomma asiaticum TaxID=266040 RepID=A0ACB7RMV1_HYAAI|nr:hypothetical protein HPB50_010104 [Hyalomma asiaticum]
MQRNNQACGACNKLCPENGNTDSAFSALEPQPDDACWRDMSLLSKKQASLRECGSFVTLAVIIAVVPGASPVLCVRVCRRARRADLFPNIGLAARSGESNFGRAEQSESQSGAGESSECRDGGRSTLRPRNPRRPRRRKGGCTSRGSTLSSKLTAAADASFINPRAGRNKEGRGKTNKQSVALRGGLAGSGLYDASSPTGVRHHRQGGSSRRRGGVLHPGAGVVYRFRPGRSLDRYFGEKEASSATANRTRQSGRRPVVFHSATVEARDLGRDK